MVSVIIPAYNCQKYIADAIDSVLEQTYTDFEIIIVNDGSTDNTSAILHQYEDNQKITIIHQKNMGAATARNVGINCSKGELIAFLDSDDLWCPEKLLKQIQCMNSNPKCNMVYSDWATFDENGIIDSNFPLSRNYPRPSGNVFNQLIEACIISTITVLIKKEVFSKVGFFNVELECGEDYELWLRIAATNQIAYCPGVVAKYRQRSGSLTHKGRSKKTFEPDEITVIKSILKQFPARTKDLSPKKIKTRFAKIYFQRGYEAYYRGEVLLAKKYFHLSALSWPWNYKTIGYFLLCNSLPPSTYSSIKRVRDKFKSYLSVKGDR